MYVYYGIEIPKDWKEWPSAYGVSPRNIKTATIEVDVPNVGGEPIFINGKAHLLEKYELTFQRYPHDVESNAFQENLGILGFLICELNEYSDPTGDINKFNIWNRNKTIISQMDNDLQYVCKALDFNYIKPGVLTCPIDCKCC